MPKFAGFDPQDPSQMCALLVFLGYERDQIIATMVTRYGLNLKLATELWEDLQAVHENSTDDDEEQRRLAAIAAEFDLDKTMHDDPGPGKS